MTGHSQRMVRRYTGPSKSAAARTAPRVSVASAGTTTVMFGIARMTAMSSTDWWVAPAFPVGMPP